MTELGTTEKVAGRVFRAACRVQLAELPEVRDTCPVYVINYRHACERGRGTQALFLKQHYVISPEYWVCYCGAVALKGPGFPHDDCDGGERAVPEGMYGWIYREATCLHCGLSVRSNDGRVVVAKDEPPEKGAIVARFQDHHVPAGEGSNPAAP